LFFRSSSSQPSFEAFLLIVSQLTRLFSLLIAIVSFIHLPHWNPKRISRDFQKNSSSSNPFIGTKSRRFSNFRNLPKQQQDYLRPKNLHHQEPFTKIAGMIISVTSTPRIFSTIVKHLNKKCKYLKLINVAQAVSFSYPSEQRASNYDFDFYSGSREIFPLPHDVSEFMSCLASSLGHHWTMRDLQIGVLIVRGFRLV
jgi:hypothetical protein